MQSIVMEGKPFSDLTNTPLLGFRSVKSSMARIFLLRHPQPLLALPYHLIAGISFLLKRHKPIGSKSLKQEVVIFQQKCICKQLDDMTTPVNTAGVLKTFNVPVV